MRALDEGGWGRTNVQMLAPPAALRGVVEFIWMDEWQRNKPPAGRIRIVADDAPHVIWHVHDDAPLGSPNIVGARSCHIDTDVSRRVVTVGARLVPGALRFLLRRSAAYFTDRTVPLAAAAPSVARNLRRARRGSATSMVDVLTTSLEQAAGGLERHCRIGIEILASDRATPPAVAMIARRLDMPERTLRAWSHGHLGMSLKQFFKIRRLHAALALHQKRPASTWSEVAAECGYADQPHLIRDCRALLGESPATFVRRGSR